MDESIDADRLQQLIRLLRAAGMNIGTNFMDDDSEVIEEEEYSKPVKPKLPETYFNPLDFYKNLNTFSNTPLSSHLGLERIASKLNRNPIKGVQTQEQPSLDLEQPEKDLEMVEKAVATTDESKESCENIEAYSPSEEKVVSVDKYSLYLPTEENIEDLGDVVSLSEKELLASELVPNKLISTIGFDYSRLFNGRFTSNGNLYYCTSQDSIGVFNTQDPYKFEHINTINAREIRWTISSVDITRDEEKLVYSTLSPLIHIVDLYTLSKFHHCIDLRQEDNGNLTQRNFRCGGCKFSGDGNEILAGSHCKGIAVYDLEKQFKTVSITNAHTDDINSV